MILDGVIFTDFSPRQSISNFPMLALRLCQHLRSSAHARDKDGALGRPSGLFLRPFPRTYAFPTKFHGDSIADFRGLWLIAKCQNRSATVFALMAVVAHNL